MKKTALIIGAGEGISGAFAKELSINGYKVCLASRNIKKMHKMATEISALLLEVDCSSVNSIKNLFQQFDSKLGVPKVVLYNPSNRVSGSITEINKSEAKAALDVSILGAFVASQEAVKRMLPLGEGAIFFTGATASIKGFANSSVFAMGKFALRGLAQSLYRELSPHGIHIAHFVIDGVVRKGKTLDEPDVFSSEAIAKTYMSILNQP
ncbi:MAG: oxidoreductase, partial [Betaproteobacteria bacterium TMED156]